MAAVKLPFLIALEQNTNDESTAYNKYYGTTYSTQKTLGLRGLIERVAFEQSVYTPDIVEGVIKRLTTVMCEQLQSGESIKWDGLGTFKPYIDGQKGGKANVVDALKQINDMIKGVHVRFIPENVKGEKLTSRAFRDTCTLQLAGVWKKTKIKVDGKDYIKREFFTMDAWRNQDALAPQNP